MYLIHRYDRERQRVSFSNIESPFFAVSEVRRAMDGNSFTRVTGLDIRTYGRAWSKKEILDAVERGDLLLVSRNPFSPLSNDTSGLYSHITGVGWKGGSFHKPPTQEKPPLPASEPIAMPQPQEPGFYIVPKSTTGDQLKSILFTQPNPAVIEKFRTLNPNLEEVKAGSMIVLSDPNNQQCTREEALLMEAAAKTNEALKPLSPSEADFMARHHAEIEGFLSQGSTAIGMGEAMFARNLEAVKGTLRDIEALHQSAFLKDGNLRSPEFFAERKRLLAQLNTGLTGLVRKGIGFPDHPNLKSALGISSRSLVHRWTKAGAPEQIPGYATHIDGVAKAAKVVKYGGWFGTAVGGGASYLKVQDVCTAGATEACEKIRFTETGSFAGGVAGGALAGGIFTTPVVGTVCLALGVPTGGMATLACGIVLVGGASVAGGALGGSAGEMMGEVLYEMTK